MIWVGGVAVLSVLGTYILRHDEAEVLTRFIRSLRVVGPAVLAPSVAILLGLGIWLVVDNEAWDFGQTWIWLALALFGAAFLIGAAFQSRAAIAAERAATAGDHAEARRHVRRWTWGMRLILLLLLVATWDMTTKPGL
jgi:Predicted integral membrane protein (DUF2269)